MNPVIKEKIRRGSKDIWNAYMLEGASYTENDMPIYESSNAIPIELISFDDAKAYYKRITKKNENTIDPRFIHFYIDDQKFDGERTSIWTFPEEAMRVISHFAGIITPDFSTNADFPEPIKRYNTYRMRTFGFWCKNSGLEVIHNVRWGTEETWAYCFDGIQKGSLVSIGTVASGLKRVINRNIFESGFLEMLKVIQPKVILIYGSSNYPVVRQAELRGIKVVTYPSKTSLVFKKRSRNE